MLLHKYTTFRILLSYELNITMIAIKDYIEHKNTTVIHKVKSMRSWNSYLHENIKD